MPFHLQPDKARTEMSRSKRTGNAVLFMSFILSKMRYALDPLAGDSTQMGLDQAIWLLD
jgi:hypothetical protein